MIPYQMEMSMEKSINILTEDFINKHKISVIMGIYNCEDTIKDSIKSIINQTYYNWELIMCDDGSVDSTLQIAKEMERQYSKQIKVIQNKQNMGLNYTLNRCLQESTGEYIARMDADDVCSSNRFMKEMHVLANETNIDFVSTGMCYFDESGIWGKVYKKEYPQKEDFLYESPFCHAPSLVRKEAFEAVEGYSVSKRLLRVEDYHLWLKMYKHGFVGKNIQECLYLMRDDRNAFNRRKFRYRINEAYVKYLAIEQLGLSKSGYLYVLKPILVGLMPYRLYTFFHKLRLQGYQ